ncbi:hypothetical protein H0H10_15915 [Streptomyces sp. TRM S81-3]|uniref:Lipoprotein n=1 Tax=Streptomyces griseicoloratus TaxID=2752516 RepID=A0A926L3A0_9ACTN|nr:hypothetical protein [Streptomyces griseicoloratus]MBD0420614.1 hypothetical protein [Streptomyces griseicoloratus]
MRRTAFAALCVVAAAATGLTGCLPGQDRADAGPGTSGQKPNTSERKTGEKKEPFAGLTGGQIAERAVKATAGAASLRITGDVPDDQGGGTIRVDLAMDRKGECAGTMSADGEGEARLVKTGDAVYLKYDEAFLRAQSEGESAAETDATVAMLAGRWTKMSVTGQDAQDIAAFCDLDTVLSGAQDVDSDATRGTTTTVDGASAIVLSERDGTDRQTLYVATEGTPYLLRVDSTSATDPGSLTFSDYDVPVPARKPDGEIVDLDALAG